MKTILTILLLAASAHAQYGGDKSNTIPSGGGSGTWTKVASASGQVGRGGTLVSCTGTPGVCTITVPSTGTGHGLVLQLMNSSGGGVTISSVTGGCSVAWTVVSGAHISSGSVTDMNQAICTSSSSGATSVAATLSTTASTVVMIYWEWSWSGASISLDTSNTASYTANTSEPGPALTLTGTNDLISQMACTASSNPSAISSPYSTNFINTDGTATYNFTAGAIAGGVTSYSAPTWTYPSSVVSLVSAVALKGN